MYVHISYCYIIFKIIYIYMCISQSLLIDIQKIETISSQKWCLPKFSILHVSMVHMQIIMCSIWAAYMQKIRCTHWSNFYRHTHSMYTICATISLTCKCTCMCNKLWKQHTHMHVYHVCRRFTFLSRYSNINFVCLNLHALHKHLIY